MDERGLVTLSDEETTLDPVDQTVELGRALTDDLFAQVAKPSSMIAEDRFLECGIVDDALSLVTRQEQVIECRLVAD